MLDICQFDIDRLACIYNFNLNMNICIFFQLHQFISVFLESLKS